MLFPLRIFSIFPGKFKRSRLAAVLLALSVLACGVHQPSVMESGVSADEFCRSSSGFLHDGETLSALVRIRVTTPEGYYPAKAALILRKPSYVRLELLPIIGPPDFFLVASPGKIKVFIPSQGKFYSGFTTEANQKKLLPWPVSLEDMMMILTGTYPSFEGGETPCRVYIRGKERVIDMNTASGRWQIIRRPETDTLLKIVHHDAAGSMVYSAEYLYDKEHSFPEKITVETADPAVEMSLTWSDVDIETSSDVSVFDLKAPDNVSEIILE